MKVTGRVVSGSRLGRELGYPTANIAVGADCEAADGVYAAWVEIDGRRHGAMVNLGVKPTFSGARDVSGESAGVGEGGVSGEGDRGVGGADRILEIHVMDFDGDLYGRELTVELSEYIRPERRFPSPSALRHQITQDEKTIKNILRCI
jgi:riboflavin kinase/FMN adenylyltransferase